MKYDELINRCEGGVMRVGHLPIGILYKKQIDRKYINVICLHECLVTNNTFNKAVEKECNANSSINDEHQIHFVSGTFDCDSDMLTVEQGNFLSVEQMVNENPLITSDSRFVNRFIHELLTFISFLHEHNIYHICLSPSNVFVRKGESAPLLISHGVYYLGLHNQADLYKGVKDYVAPEVIEHGVADERSDVYSAGKFIEYLYSLTDMPYAYKTVVKKATAIDPNDRYNTIAELISALKKKKILTKILTICIILILLFGAVVFIYKEFFPKTNTIEFVKPVSEQEDNIQEEGLKPMEEFGFTDSITTLTDKEKEDMKKYQEKCEQIFRKQYTKEAERILSKIYSSSNMGTNVNNFIVGSQASFNELLELRIEIAERSGIDEVKSQRIATEIIDKITEQKKSTLLKHGIQKDAN